MPGSPSATTNSTSNWKSVVKGGYGTDVARELRLQRVGRGGALFDIYKFRSLAIETPKYIEKLSPQDPRITRVGRVIRRACLDELPQLLNVLRGEMALIGPRPEMQFIVDLLGPRERQREMLKPGITGWWQVHHRDNVPLQQNIHRDLCYLERVGPRIDLQILLMTIRVVMTGAVATVRPGGPAGAPQGDSDKGSSAPLEAGDGSEISVGASAALVIPGDELSGS